VNSIDSSKEGNTHNWYIQTLKKSEMVENFGDSKDIFVYRSWAIYIWDTIKLFLDQHFKEVCLLLEY